MGAYYINHVNREYTFKCYVYVCVCVLLSFRAESLLGAAFEKMYDDVVWRDCGFNRSRLFFSFVVSSRGYGLGR